MSEQIEISSGANINMQITERENAFLAVVEAICGAGKTYEFCKQINLDISKKYIVAAKTEMLCGEIYRKLLADKVDVELISTEGLNMRKRNAQTAVTAALHRAVTGGKVRVIICCQKALELLSVRLHYDDALKLALFDYQVILDEAPAAKRTYQDSFDLSLIGHTQWLKSSVVIDGQLYATNQQELRNALRAGDTRSTGFIVALINGDKIHALKTSPQELFLKCSARSDIYTLCKMYGEKKVWLFAANAKKTAFVSGGIRNGHFADVSPCEQVVIPPERNKHHNTSRIKIHVLTNKKASIRQHEKHLVQIQSQLKSELVKIGHPFIWTTNKDFIDSYAGLFGDMDCEHVPYSAEGVNSYTQYDVAVFLGCVNMRDSEKEYYGSPDDVTDFEFNNTEGACYQFLARTCVRLQGVAHIRAMNRPCWFFVLDENQANYIKENYFPEAEIITAGAVEIESKAIGEGMAAKGDKTQSQVFEAANELKAKGGKVTARMISDYLKQSISQPTISRHLKTWKQSQA